jgi:hypothetical protein
MRVIFKDPVTGIQINVRDDVAEKYVKAGYKKVREVEDEKPAEEPAEEKKEA